MKRFVPVFAVFMMILAPAFAGDMDALRAFGATAAIAKMCYGSDAITNLLDVIGRKKLGDKSAFYVADNMEIRDSKEKLEKDNLWWDVQSQKYVKISSVKCNNSDEVKREEQFAIQQLTNLFLSQ